MTEELDRALQTRAGRRVEYLSITWTSLEAIIGVTVGILAGSVALIGFGADSIIEVASSCVWLWWLAEGSIRAISALISRFRAPRRSWLVLGRSNCRSLHAANHHPRRHCRWCGKICSHAIFEMESGCSAAFPGQL